MPLLHRKQDHKARNVGMSVAAAAPFAGLIGQKPLIHDPTKMEQFQSAEELANAAQSGDILLTGGQLGPHSKLHDHFSDAKWKITAAGGNPRAYHTGVVGTAGDGKIHTFESHPYNGTAVHHNVQAKGDRLTLLRPRSPDVVSSNLSGAVDHLELNNALPRIAFKSPEKYPTLAGSYAKTPEVLQGSTYGSRKGLTAGLKELFLPKLRSPAAVERSRESAQSALSAVRHGSSRAKLVRALEHYADTHDVVGPSKLNRVLPPDLERICSTLPSAAMPKGHTVVPGKLVTDIMPADFLRSNAYEAVGHFSPPALKNLSTAEKVMAHGPTISRVLAGAGLAGAVYGGNKLYHHVKGDDQTLMQRLQKSLDELQR